MKNNNVKRLMLLLLIFTLSFSLVLPQTGYSINDTTAISIENPTFLNKGETLSQTYDETGNVHWYEVKPSNEDIAANTHMRLKVSGEVELEVKVYSSKEKAMNDVTFDRYQAFNSAEQSVQLDFPFAWNGSYYIKVTNKNEVEEGADIEFPNYSIGYESVNLPVGNMEEAESCPVELSTSGKGSGKEIITNLHTVRDELLNESESGKNLTKLYYEAAPHLVADIIFDKKLKEEVYQNLFQLKTLFKELAKFGGNTSYKITSEDQQAITKLYTITINAVPANLAKKIKLVATEQELATLSDQKLKNVLNDYGLLDTDTNKVIIKMKDGKSINSITKSNVGKTLGSNNLSALTSSTEIFDDVYVTDIGDESQKALIQKLNKIPEVEYVEVVQTYKALSNDVQYPYQWSLDNKAQEGGKAKADIGHTKLQVLLKKIQLKETIIAVIDTGVDGSLADLEETVLVEKGKNFIARNNDASDDHGHGTHVSGIIAAKMDNGYSMAGIHPVTKILPVKVLDANGDGETDQIALGIIYAADQGAKVINLSLGGGYSRTIEYALQYAAAKNVTIIAASGNGGGEGISYPASSKHAVAVGGTNRLDIVADYSDYGKELALVAPGSDIPSLVPDGNVVYMTGTSMAAPHVAAVAGLLLSQNSKLKPKDIKKVLWNTATDITFVGSDNPNQECYNDDYEVVPCNQIPGHDYLSGGGRLNAFGAVSSLELGLKVNPLLDNSNVVTGSAKSGTLIQVLVGKKVIGKATADSKGKFSVKINKVQPANSLLYISGANKTLAAEAAIKTVVKKGIAPAAPKVNMVSNKSTVVTGKTSANLQVKIKNNAKKVIASGMANSKGEFKITIKKQKAGTILYATTTDLAKRESKAVKIVVQDKIAPNAPKVNAVTTNDTFVKGKTEALATVAITNKGKKVGSKKADSKGNFKITIKKQKVNTVLDVAAKDKAGNTSKTTKVKVKKYIKK